MLKTRIFAVAVAGALCSMALASCTGNDMNGNRDEVTTSTETATTTEKVDEKVSEAADSVRDGIRHGIERVDDAIRPNIGEGYDRMGPMPHHREAVPYSK